MTIDPNAPYDIWDTRRLVRIRREVKPEYLTWLPLFASQVNSEDEYIDFESIAPKGRKLAAFALPLARGKSIYDRSSRLTRFKPAYVKAEDAIDPLKPLKKLAGEEPLLGERQLTPMQRISVLKAGIVADHDMAVRRTWNFLAAKAVIDAQVTIVSPDYPSVLVDFGRDADLTVTLGGGERFGDSGVSAVDFIQSMLDAMNDAEHGAVAGTIEMGSLVWNYLRGDTEFLAHMDTQTRGGNITIERGLVSSEKRFKVGEMLIGGASGARLELWVNNDVYVDMNTGTSTRYVGTKEMVFYASPMSIDGVRAFGRIIDRDAQYAPIEIFQSNWMTVGAPKTEFITTQSSPLMVPINPNATAKATVLA